MPKKRSSNPNFPVVLIVAAALGALLFTVGAGVLVYRNTANYITAAQWVEHTQEVLTSIQNASNIVQSVETNTRLFLLSKNEENLSSARSNAVRLDGSAVHLRGLVSDNPAQTPNTDRLTACANDLIHDLDRPDADVALPRDHLLDCRQALGFMSEQERRLLKERTEASQHISYVSLLTELGFVAFSLVVLVALFSLLLRDALHRRGVSLKTTRVNEELAGSIRTLEERAQEAHLLATSRDELQLCVSVDQVHCAAANSLGQLLPGSSGSLCAINNSRHIVETVSSWGHDPGHFLASPRTPDIFALASCCGLRAGQMRWRRPGLSEIHCAHFLGAPPNSYLCIPMVAYGDTIGILYLESSTPQVADLIERRIDSIRQLIQLTGMTVASLHLRTRLENQSIRDSLTGLFNRHFMEIALERELSRAVRKQSTLAVLMVDVDHFKKFNDRFGHGAGDEVLKEVAKSFLASIRAEDIACRYGGEEFTLILPDITPEAAQDRAEHIRKRIAALRSSDTAVFGEVTVSIGVALYPRDGRGPDILLRKADEALYRAKRQGRNRVTLADPIAELVDT